MCPAPDGSLDTQLARILSSQHGVIARRQVLGAGGSDAIIESRLWHRRWARVHPGVYVDHTGPLAVEQLAMAAVLYAQPAVLAGEWAFFAHGLRAGVRPGRVRVAVAWSRRIQERDGIAMTRLRRLDEMAQWHRSLPRLRVEDATLLLASEHLHAGRERDAIAILADVCQQGGTTASRLVSCLDERHPRLFGRRFLRLLLDDVATGTYSVLEHRFLTRVERPHGLPRGRRQQRAVGERTAIRDVCYPRLRTVIELDGRLGHEWGNDRWLDLDRDLDAAIAEQSTTRLGWGQVIEPCRLAGKLAGLFAARGWTGTPHPCRDCPPTGGLRSTDEAA